MNNMFFEKLNMIDIDLEKLRSDVVNHVFTLGKGVIQGEEYETPAYHGFGGWSVTSQSGDWRDGFDFFQNDSGKAMEVFFPTNDNNFKSLKFFNIAHSLEYKIPTEAYVGEIARIVDQIEALGLTPRRVRITCLKAGSKSTVHKDADGNEYHARLHIPIFTNKKCVHICDGFNLHMVAGTATMLWTNRWHQIRNDSNEDRYHLIMDAYDTKKITEHFKYEADIQELEDFAQMMRKNIDEAVITPEQYEIFETARKQFITKGSANDYAKTIG